MFLAEQHVGDLGVSAGREPLGLVVAAADMRIDGHSFGNGVDDGVVDARILTLDCLRITSEHAVLEILGDQHAPRAVIELQVAASGVEQVTGHLAVRLDERFGKLIIVGVRIGEVLGRASLQQEQGLCGGRNGDLGDGVVVLELLDELEVFDERMVFSGDFAGNGGGLGHFGTVGAMDGDRIGALGNALEAPHEVEMPIRAAKFAIGNHMQAGGLLLGHEFGDRLVFDRFELGRVDFTCGEILARGLELGRTQIGADHVGVEWRVMLVCHWTILSKNSA